jgi:hypothetical protein
MTQPLKYEGSNEPLSNVVEFLSKGNYDDLAAKVIDVYALASNNIEQYNYLAKLYLDVMAKDKAEEYALKALAEAKEPQTQYNIRANLGKMYNNINEPEKALIYTNINLTITPKDPDSLLEKVFSLYLLNRKQEARDILYELKDRIDTLQEKHKDIVKFNLGTYDMEEGKFLQGLAGFLLNVKKLEIWFSPRELPFQFWNGGAYPGKTLILFMEGGGIGDEFIIVRFMDNLKAMGFNPVFYSQRPDIAKIFNDNGYPAVTSINHLPKDSLWTYAMQVPIWLKMDAPDVMRKDQYLKPTQDARDKFAFIKESKKFKIGVRWQGNAKNERDLHRKIYLDDVMTMLKSVYGDTVEYYNLQIGDGHDEAAKYPELIDITDKIKTYDDTFAILENLDLVVTSCTSVLHAAAITGIKTCALIPVSAYFTWVSPAPDRTSVWYGDHLKLFRQVTPKIWDEPIEEMKQYLMENKIGKD